MPQEDSRSSGFRARTQPDAYHACGIKRLLLCRQSRRRRPPRERRHGQQQQGRGSVRLCMPRHIGHVLAAPAVGHANFRRSTSMTDLRTSCRERHNQADAVCMVFWKSRRSVGGRSTHPAAAGGNACTMLQLAKHRPAAEAPAGSNARPLPEAAAAPPLPMCSPASSVNSEVASRVSGTVTLRNDTHG